MSEGNLEFTFPDNWEVTKYDDWPFYVDKFKNSCCGNKAVDFLAIEKDSAGTRTLWLIEVKDYRIFLRTKTIELWEEMALKTRDTLAGLFVAGINESHQHHAFAQSSLKAARLRVVLHLEIPQSPAGSYNPTRVRADVLDKLKKSVKIIDAHPLVVSMGSPNLRWATTHKQITPVSS